MSTPTDFRFPALIQREIEDPEFSDRVHGTPELYRAGCRGTFCTKAHRERMRQAYANRLAARGQEVKPYAPRLRAVLDPLIEEYHDQYLQLLAHRALEGGDLSDTA